MRHNTRNKTVWLKPLLSALAALLLLLLIFRHFNADLSNFWPFSAAEPPEPDVGEPFMLRLVHTANSEDEPQAEEIDIEQAVVGFVAAEMPASYGEQALAAQAVAARSYAWQKYQSEGEVCDDSAHCLAYLDEQARRERFGSSFAEYEQKLQAAAAATAGLVLVQDGAVVPAYFHACCGGHTESAAACWGGVSYFPAAACYWDSSAERSAVSSSFWPKESLAERLQVTPAQLALLYVSSTTPSGRVKEVRCASQSWSGSEFRQLLGLASTNFSWLAGKEGFWFTTLGSGHGVGLCQQGAGGLAAQGYDWRQILAVYFAGCEVAALSEVAANPVD